LTWASALVAKAKQRSTAETMSLCTINPRLKEEQTAFLVVAT